jgi:hypothetical protein
VAILVLPSTEWTNWMRSLTVLDVDMPKQQRSAALPPPLFSRQIPDLEYWIPVPLFISDDYQ